MVNGLLIQTRATDIGRLQRPAMASMAAITICMGTGRNIQNRPINAAPETERRLRCQISVRPSICATGFKVACTISSGLADNVQGVYAASNHYACRFVAHHCLFSNLKLSLRSALWLALGLLVIARVGSWLSSAGTAAACAAGDQALTLGIQLADRRQFDRLRLDVVVLSKPVACPALSGARLRLTWYPRDSELIEILPIPGEVWHVQACPKLPWGIKIRAVSTMACGSRGTTMSRRAGCGLARVWGPPSLRTCELYKKTHSENTSMPAC